MSEVHGYETPDHGILISTLKSEGNKEKEEHKGTSKYPVE